MERREFVKAAIGMAGTLGLAQAVKAGTQAEKTLIRHLVARGNPSDIDTLNGALGAEYKAIYAYGVALDSGLLRGDGKELSKLFRLSHQGHSDILQGAVKSLGGTPVENQASYDLGVRLATQGDIAKYAYSLERGAAQAYYNAVSELEDPKLKEAAAQILTDEVFHATMWYKILGYHPLASGFNQLPEKI